MDPNKVSLILGVLSATVTAVGWVFLNHLSRQKDREERLASNLRADKIKRLEISLKQVEAQIAEFYGPVDGLIHQIWAVWEVKERIKSATAEDTWPGIDHFLAERYFSEMHTDLRRLIGEKVHLIEGATIPESFYDYMKHSVMENIQITLWNDKKISTLKAEGIKWPGQFQLDVQFGLHRCMQRYEALLEELRSGPQEQAGSPGASLLGPQMTPSSR
ncbi:hypothetical protein [Paraburkholderia sp. RL17-347-BIC-D]|uniref:hypothetical protein n=1 Tax=Paraburkholderia sp. RL17-347-BIC-D TaxID=3031632 RepID=UPI0038BC9B13